MTEQMTSLRRRMIDEMAIRNVSPNTQKIYIRAVANFSAYHGWSPDKRSFEDVRDYQLHLASCGLKVGRTNVIMCALRFFYGTTLGKLNVSEHIPIGRTEDSLPAVLARKEAERLLKAVSDLRMRTISEAVALTIHGTIASAWSSTYGNKGRKDRFVNRIPKRRREK